MKTIDEMIAVMTAYKNGAEIESIDKFSNSREYKSNAAPVWNWSNYDYRIKEQKKTITIEKWLFKNDGEYIVREGDSSYIKGLLYREKVKLLDSYEVEINE